ncbi:MAG: lipopolysaccharide biosynthesis protein [Acidobacteria bacterium]|nr:lipopolysaccharide biosynthesis protein [Acidobacteriota bacterium]
MEGGGRLALHSAAYIVATVVGRGVSYLLLLVIAVAMSPADFGILAITTTVGGLLAMVLGLSLEGAFIQMQTDHKSVDELRSFTGTLLVFWVVVPGAAALLLDYCGRAGFLEFFAGVPFRPYLRMVLWTSYLVIFINGLQAVYIASQRPLSFLYLTSANAVVMVCLTVYLVFYGRMGARGYLLAQLICAGALGLWAVYAMGRMSSRNMAWKKLREALRFSVPLVPHGISNWALNLSDRFVLQRYVSMSQIGLYSLGCQWSSLVALFSSSANNAFAPIANERLVDEKARDSVPALGTYMLLGITFAGLGVSLLGNDIIRLLAPPSYHGAARVVPWVVLGFVFQGVYVVWSRGTWFSRRTVLVPVLTAAAGAINIGLNLLFVPRYGIVAAAVNTAVGYGTLALMHGYLATQCYRIQWEYARWLKILGSAIVLFLACQVFSVSNLVLDVVCKMLSLCILFPVSLSVLGFFTQEEKRMMSSLPARILNCSPLSRWQRWRRNECPSARAHE